nr:PREDICTED: uncharacterized protein LOC109037322 [Bemisia tabaci]
MDSNEPLCLISNTNNNKELIFETHADQNQKPKKDEIKDEIFFDHDSKQSLPIDSEDEKSDNDSCDRDVDPTSHRSKSPISPKKRGETGVDRVCGDELVSAETESLDVESLGAKHEVLPFDSEINSEKAAMFKVYQPWVIKTYGDFTKTKTVSLKKYDRIVRTLLGLIPNCAENSKFRFWIRSKGFRLGLPSSIAPVSDPNQLYVLGRKSGTEGRSYRKVAVVEQFFEIIYQVHVESGGKHAGQKKTYRTITQTYAFLPREAVTKFLLGCAECQKRLDLDSLGSDIFKNNKDTPVKRAQKRKHNTWDPSPSSFSIDPSCYSTNLSIPLDNRKRKYLKLPKYPSELCLADDEGNNSDGYVPTDKYEDSREFYPTCKESSTRNPTKAIEYHRDDKLFQVATKTESDGEEESKAKPSLKLCIKEETDEKTDLVLDFRYKSLKSLARQKFKDQDKDTEDSEKDEASDVERKYVCESNKLHPKLDSRDPLYKIKSEFYLRHQIDHQNVRKERDYFVNVPNLLPPAPVLSLRLGHEDGYPSEKKITDPVRACNSKKYLLPHANGSSRRKRFSSKRYTSTPEPMSHLYSRNSSQSLRYGPRNSSSSTNENESCENSYGAEILDLSPINSQNRISKFKLPQSKAPVSYIQIPVWNPDLLRYHSKGRTMESGRTARVPDADPSECPDRLSAHPTDEDSDSDHPTSTCERRTKHVGYFDQEPTSSQVDKSSILITPSPKARTQDAWYRCPPLSQPTTDDPSGHSFIPVPTPIPNPNPPPITVPTRCTPPSLLFSSY